MTPDSDIRLRSNTVALKLHGLLQEGSTVAVDNRQVNVTVDGADVSTLSDIVRSLQGVTDGLSDKMSDKVIDLTPSPDAGPAPSQVVDGT